MWASVCVRETMSITEDWTEHNSSDQCLVAPSINLVLPSSINHWKLVWLLSGQPLAYHQWKEGRRRRRRTRVLSSRCPSIKDVDDVWVHSTMCSFDRSSLVRASFSLSLSHSTKDLVAMACWVHHLVAHANAISTLNEWPSLDLDPMLKVDVARPVQTNWPTQLRIGKKKVSMMCLEHDSFVCTFCTRRLSYIPVAST